MRVRRDIVNELRRQVGLWRLNTRSWSCGGQGNRLVLEIE